MALLWRKIKDSKTYEIRSAGGSRRLYIDRVLHTQYNARTVVTGPHKFMLTLPGRRYRPPGARHA